MSKTSDFLTGLAGDVQLGLAVEGQIVPIIIGTIKEIKVLTEGQTIEYTVALSTGKANADAAVANFTAARDLINAELAKLGKPPLT